MAAQWMRRGLLAAVCASTAWLAACGSSVESPFTPLRAIAFGDGFTDIGQVGGMAYTVNDGSTNNWTLDLVQRYGLTLKPASAGGLSYAQGNARITATPDAAGGAAPSVQQQVDQFLATQTPAESDMVLVGAGTADLIAGMQEVQAGTLAADAFKAQARAAGDALGLQIKRLYDAGSHVVVTGVYDLGRTPWATALGQQTLLSAASLEFNTGLLLRIEPLGKLVRYIEITGWVNPPDDTVHRPYNYIAFANNTTPVCTSVDPGPGIGIGTNQVNSALCTSATLVSGADPSTYMFADPVYITPAAQRQISRHAHDDVLNETW